MASSSLGSQISSLDLRLWQCLLSIFFCLSVTVLLCDSESSTSTIDIPSVDPSQPPPSPTPFTNSILFNSSPATPPPTTATTPSPSLINNNNNAATGHPDFESLQNDQLCPDLITDTVGTGTGPIGGMVDPMAGKYPHRTIIVNLPKKRSHDIPCNFKVKGSNNKMTNVGVRSIHLSNSPWNYDLSDTCTSFIKFRITDPSVYAEEEVKEPEVICRIWKVSKSLQQPKLIHPILWNFPNRKIGISFPSTGNLTNNNNSNLSNVISWIYLNSAKGTSTTTTNNNNNNGGGGEKRLSEQKYLQIVFTVSSGQTCSLRVQQYLLDQNREGCNGTTVMPAKFKFCGFYRCSDNIHLMSQLGSWTYINWGMNNEFEEPRESVLRSHLSDSGYFRRRRTYWLTAIIRSSIIPALFFGMVFLGYKFFCVLYPNYPVLPERRARNQAASAIRAFNNVPIDASNLRESLAPHRNGYSRSLPTSPESRINCQHHHLHQHHHHHHPDIRIEPIPEPPAPEYEAPPSYAEATKV